MPQKMTKSGMKFLIRKAVKYKEDAVYTCWYAKSMIKAREMAVDVCKSNKIKFEHPIVNRSGESGRAGNVFEFEGGGSLALFALEMQQDIWADELWEIKYDMELPCNLTPVMGF